MAEYFEGEAPESPDETKLLTPMFQSQASTRSCVYDGKRVDVMVRGMDVRPHGFDINCDQVYF